ncbi:hypothetical protein TSUD_280040, partial [Trifolium subterraneum]
MAKRCQMMQQEIESLTKDNKKLQEKFAEKSSGLPYSLQATFIPEMSVICSPTHLTYWMKEKPVEK